MLHLSKGGCLMLKREYAAAAVLAGMIGISVWNVKKLDKLTGDIEIALCKSRTAVERLDFKRSKAYYNQSIELWEAAEGHCSVFLPADRANETTKAFYELEKCLAEEDPTVCTAAYEALRENLESLRKTERPSLGSIL